jgi:hypothetical protein
LLEAAARRSVTVPRCRRRLASQVRADDVRCGRLVPNSELLGDWLMGRRLPPCAGPWSQTSGASNEGVGRAHYSLLAESQPDQVSALAHFADSGRTSPEVREVPLAVVSRCSKR